MQCLGSGATVDHRAVINTDPYGDLTLLEDLLVWQLVAGARFGSTYTKIGTTQLVADGGFMPVVRDWNWKILRTWSQVAELLSSVVLPHLFLRMSMLKYLPWHPFWALERPWTPWDCIRVLRCDFRSIFLQPRHRVDISCYSRILRTVCLCRGEERLLRLLSS